MIYILIGLSVIVVFLIFVFLLGVGYSVFTKGRPIIYNVDYIMDQGFVVFGVLIVVALLVTVMYLFGLGISLAISHCPK